MDSTDLIKYGAGAAAAGYAVNNAIEGKRPTSMAGQVTELGGTFFALWLLWHFLVIPYLIITAVLFGLPAIIVLAVTANAPHASAGPFIVTCIPCLLLWCRYALYKWLWPCVKAVDGFFGGRYRHPEVIDNPTVSKPYYDTWGRKIVPSNYWGNNPPLPVVVKAHYVWDWKTGMPGETKSLEEHNR